MTDSPTSAQPVWTIARLLDWTREFFARKGVDEPRLSAEILLAKALSCRRIDLYTRYDQTPASAHLDVFRDFVNRAAEHTPIAYLVGEKEFFSLDFEVSPAVLIPRPETEVLVERVIDHARSKPDPAIRLFDFGTGSGCIVVALLKYLPNARAVASDISGDALAVASRNAARHGVADRVQFVLADGLDLPANLVPEGGFDVIVANPPYIAAAELAGIPRAVREHEPHAALTDGADGLRLYRALAESAGNLLQPDGALFVEIAENGCAAVSGVFAAAGRLARTGVWRDQIGPHDRVLRFERAPAAASEGG